MVRALHRRAFVASALSLVAGCVSRSDDDSSSDEPANDGNGSGNRSNDDRRDRSACRQSVDSSDPYPDVRVESDEVPADADVSLCARPVRPFDDDGSAKVAVELTNVGERTAEYRFGVSPPYGGVFAAHQDRDAALYLVPDDREHVGPDDGLVPAEPANGCWRADAVMAVEDIGLPATIDPAETIREEYTLLAAPDGECLTSGTYRTEQEHYDPIEGGWGFEVTLSG